jgi:hypothetical protein
MFGRSQQHPQQNRLSHMSLLVSVLQLLQMTTVDVRKLAN